MALENWDWYIELADSRNFTKAAETLQMSQQALSARVAKLEKDLDAKLVVRSNPLLLTNAGLVFLMYAREQQQARTDMFTQIAEATGGTAGVLKVGVSHMRGRALMPSVARELHGRYPKVCLQLIEGTNRELVRMVEHAEVDAAVFCAINPHPDVDIEPLYEEEVVLAIRADLLESVTQLPALEAERHLREEGIGLLAQCPFLLEDVEDIGGRIAYSELRNARIKPNVVATSENLPTLLAMCAEGIGALFCPANLMEVSSAVDDSIVRIPLSATAHYSISLGVPRQGQKWKALEAFEEILKEQTAAR